MDVTADQFPRPAEWVVVTTRSPWHESFAREVRGIADFRVFGEATRAAPVGAFGLICITAMR